MLKAVGLLGLVLASGLLGMGKSAELKARIDLLEDFLRMILQLKSRMNYFKEPLTSILRTKQEIKPESRKESGSKNDFSKAFELLGRTGDDLRQKNGEIGQIWADRAEKIYKGTPLTVQDMELIRYPGQFLGQTDWENQQARFDYLENRLQQQIKEAEECFRIKGPLYRKIGFFLGGLAAVIFI